MEFNLKNVTYKDVLKYFVYFIIMVMLSMAKTSQGIAPFHIGFFSALIFCRESVFALSPLYIAALLISSPTLDTLIIAIVPPLVFGATKLMHKLFARSIKMLHINIYALLAQLPIIILGTSSAPMLVNAIITVVIAQIFTYCAVVIMYALLIRGMKYKFTTDEVACGLVLIGAIALGLFRVDIFGFRPFYLFAPFILMLVVYAGTPISSMLLALTLGIGAGVMQGNVMVAGGLTLCVAIALVFVKSNIYISAISFLLADLFAGMYFTAFGEYNYLHLIAVAVGLFAFVILPKRTRSNIMAIFGGGANNSTARNMILRNRKDLNLKLNSVSRVFQEMGEVLCGDVRIKGNYTEQKLKLAEEVAIDVCSNCSNKRTCFNALGTDTSVVISSMVEAGLTAGEVTQNDIPPFLSSRCVKVQALVKIINSKLVKYHDNHDRVEQISSGRFLLGEQMFGVGELLSDLAKEVKNTVTFDTEREKRIIEELSYQNIVCNDIMVYNEGDKMAVNLVVRTKDSNKKALTFVVSALLKADFVKVDNKESDIAGYVTVRLAASPKYSLAYGVSTKIMDGSGASGDTYSTCKIDEGKFLIALSDGMGSGELAHYNSCSTISMIENFYKAGFNNNVILTLINKLLSTYNEESFTCLDMVMLDLCRGVADFIKLGGVNSLIRRGDKIIPIESGSLPLGIVEEAEPHTERRMLLENDTIVMMSDGIVDALTEEGVGLLMVSDNSLSPQVLADKILQEATRGGAKDDSTVIVARIFIKDKKQAKKGEIE